jgi:hypothetical protein
MLDQDDERYNWIPTDDLEMLKIGNMFLFRHGSNPQKYPVRCDWCFAQAFARGFSRGALLTFDKVRKFDPRWQVRLGNSR